MFSPRWLISSYTALLMRGKPEGTPVGNTNPCPGIFIAGPAWVMAHSNSSPFISFLPFFIRAFISFSDSFSTIVVPSSFFFRMTAAFCFILFLLDFFSLLFFFFLLLLVLDEFSNPFFISNVVCRPGCCCCFTPPDKFTSLLKSSMIRSDEYATKSMPKSIWIRIRIVPRCKVYTCTIPRTKQTKRNPCNTILMV